MNTKVKPTTKELIMHDDDFIVSKTNIKGQITYANSTFMRYSGYKQSKTYMHQHKLVRHPEMPKTVFHLLWQTIKAGKEFNGYIKNMHQDGSFYWVFANVTPSFSTGNNRDIIGYYSVRRKPKAEALSVIKPLYKKILQAEQQAATSKAAIAAGTQVLHNTLEQQEMGYDQFVLSL